MLGKPACLCSVNGAQLKISDSLRLEQLLPLLLAPGTTCLHNGWECASVVTCKALMIVTGHGACERTAAQLKGKVGHSLVCCCARLFLPIRVTWA